MDKKLIKESKELFMVLPLLSEIGISKDSINSGDKPDLSFRYGERSIGVEITECHPDQILLAPRVSQIQYSQWIDYTCEKFTLFLRKQNFTHLIIHIGFKQYETIQFDRDLVRGKYVDSALLELFKLFSQCNIFLEVGACGRVDSRRYDNLGEFRYIESLSWRYYPPYPTSVFPTRVVSSTLIPYKAIHSTIGVKNEKYQNYKLLPQNVGLDEYWLVIVVPKTCGYHIDEYIHKDINTPYKRIYLLQWLEILRIK